MHYSREEFAKQRLIEKAIDKRIHALFPDLFPEEGVRDVRIEAMRPREYMGRLDAGKKHWTIDVKETATYSRTKQVRVKVAADGTFTFDEAKLKALVERAQAIFKAHEDARRKTHDAQALAPDMPRGMHATARPDGLYEVTGRWLMPLDGVKKLVQAVDNATTPI